MKGIFLVLLITILSCSDVAVTKKGVELNDESGRFAEVCINGHIYYYKAGVYNGFLASKFSDNGLPVKCEKIKGLK